MREPFFSVRDEAPADRDASPNARKMEAQTLSVTSYSFDMVEVDEVRAVTSKKRRER